MGKEEYGRHDEKQSNQRISVDVLSSLKRNGIRVRKSDNLFLLDRLPSGSPLQVTMTLCPLYAPVSVSESKLINEPATIEQSRVAAKWKVGVQALEAINEAGLRNGQEIEAVLTFADLGVITGDILKEDPSVLAYHERIYVNAAERDLRKARGISYHFQRYSDIVPSFPRFIKASGMQAVFNKTDRGLSSGVLFKVNPDLRPKITAFIDRLIQEGVVFDQSVYIPGTETISVKTQEFIISLVRQFDFELAEGFMRQYGTFDARTTQRDALNIFMEREAAGVLLQATNLFPHRHNPRVDILC